MSTPSTPSIPAGTSIGHVHLKVADLDRSIRFYHELMGFDITAQYEGQAAFLSAGDYHHHIGLNTWESLNGQPPAQGIILLLASSGWLHLSLRHSMPEWFNKLMAHYQAVKSELI